MEAQNAAESDTPRHAGASPPHQETQQEKHQHPPRQGSGSGPDPDRQSPPSLRPSSPSRDASKTRASQPPVSSASASAAARTDDAPPPPPSVDRDSDAETIVLPGKDGHSPSKIRKVRQEDKSESDGDGSKACGQTTAANNHGDKHAAGSRSGEPVKKKRLSSAVDKDRQPRHKDGASSGLSSAPTSPPHHQTHQHQQHQQHRQLQRTHHLHHRRRSDAAAASLSDSESSHHKPSSASLREKLKSGERLLPHKRKAAKAESDDETDQRKARRQRTTSASLDTGRVSKDLKSASSRSQLDARIRSISPQQRHHRRSISTQLPSQTLNSLKKKRLPPPLQSTDYQSDESSTSGSPHPRHSKLRSLATPATSESHASPVKMAPHKKHLDAHGQTFLARACARGEYASVKRRLSDRPEDLNVADYAGNTPLQIAAINGCEDIVKLLIDAGCNLDCVNYDKDTPLLDAVDNGHVAVVKLLLDAGVNPRKANVNGEEPIDRVSDDTENAEEIRALLLAAKKRQGERRRTSEDRHSHIDCHDARDSHAPDSPRHSPAATAPGISGRRGGTVRSTKTRNDLLYMPLDDKTLRQAAGRGDEETVARILQVKENFDDAESMVAAARGGHDLVIQLLLGLGGANADPGPVPTLPAEFATPILAAIGQENIKVVELLLEQQNFDPTRRFKGETYYEIARRRQGTNWKEEEHMLKNAYDEYKRSHRDATKTKSPARRERERERERGKEEKRAKRDEAKEEPRPHKRNASSPARESDSRKKLLSSSHVEDNSLKRGPGRPRKDDRPPNLSDREVSPTPSHKPPKSKRTESDFIGISSEGETVKPRRKLVSKGELKGERERQKRGSLTSNSSGMKEPSSPNESRNEDSSDKQKLSEKYHDRTKALKRDESKDRLSVSGDGTAKRIRTSVTPDRPSDCDKDSAAEAPIKRRRLECDNQEKRLQKRTASAEGNPRKLSSSRDSISKPSVASLRKSREEEPKGTQDERDVHRKDSGRSSSGDKSIRVKSEDDDTEMPDADRLRDIPESRDRKARENEEEQAKKRELAEREEAKKEEERKRVKAEEKRKREQEETRQREEEKKKRKEQEEREMQRKREEDEARKLREQAERERREAEEAARRQEEEKRRLEEDGRRREEEKRKREEEEQRKREKDEEERKQREEAERLHRERLEREAAEEARRQREEEERKERELRERAHREELERKRAAKEAEQKRLEEEQERSRLDNLPPLLRWLSTAANPKTVAIAEKFKHMHGARYDTIRPEANNTPEGREQWVLNTHVALLLGEKDLELSRYASWERVPVSSLAKLTIWRTEWSRYSLIAEKLWDIGRQIPGYYGDEDASTMSFHTKQRLKLAAWDKFLNTDMFFVKVSDLMYIIPNMPHLRSIKLGVEYCELMESESEAIGWKTRQKWKQDPDADRYHGFAPRFKYYVNGVVVGEDMPKTYQTSKTPFPEVRVPRRGLVRVLPDDPDYDRICLKQGLEHLIKGEHQSPSPLANGLHSSPVSQASATTARSAAVNGTNGHTGWDDDTKTTAIINGGDMLNGLNGTAS